MPRSLVVGAGPAGLSAAIGLLRLGHSVTVLEQRPKWQGRVCGGFLNAEAVRHLDWLGVLDEVRKDAVVITHTTLSFGNSTRAIDLPHHGELGVSRQRLEEILLERVRREGGEIRFGERAAVGDAVVIAGGRGIGNKGNWYGWNANFENVAQQPGEMSLHFYPGGYVGTLTYPDGQTNICGLVKKKPGQTLAWDTVYENALDRNFGFKEKMKQARRVTEWRGVGPLPFGIHLNESEIRVGDAAAVGEPFMGEGIGRALSAGPMLYDTHVSSQSFVELWNTAYRGRFRLSRTLRQLLLERPILFFIFAKSLDLSLLGNTISKRLWRTINEYGYHPQNLSRPKFREMLSV